jgi:hypothetical protein
LSLLSADPEIAPECVPFTPTAAGAELAQLTDDGVIPASLDRRRASGDRLRMLNRTLIELGGGRRR